MDDSLLALPGGSLVAKGLADLASGTRSEEALLVTVAAPRLRGLGFEIAPTEEPGPPEHALFAMVEERLPQGAHAAYNALIARIVSFAQASRSARGCTGPPSP